MTSVASKRFEFEKKSRTSHIRNGRRFAFLSLNEPLEDCCTFLKNDEGVVERDQVRGCQRDSPKLNTKITKRAAE